MFSKPLDLTLRTFAQRNSSTERAIPPPAVEFTNSAIETFLLSSSTKAFGSFFREMDGDARFETAVDCGKRRLDAQLIPAAGLFVKRIMDLLLSSVALVLLCPFLFVIALVIKLESPGPVIYASWRAGKRGKKFACYKFRTMVDGADELKDSLRRFNERGDPFFKIADDPRVTRVGRFLRKYSLDELPQFWNALKGDMSLVGPRPHPLDDYARYRSDGTADRPAATSVLVRRHARDRIVNVWLIFIVFVGVMIAVADGLTRVSIFDREEAWNGPFEYVPYQGAFLFAGLTLLLMIGYARKARVSLIEGLFLWFAFNTTAYTRDFSYVRWPGTSLFITDVVLLVLLVSIYLLRRPRFSKIPLPATVLLVLFFGAGALSAARGLWGHHDALVVLRDSALVVYTLFLLVCYQLSRSWLSIKRVAVWFLLGSGLGALNGFAWFIASPQERRFIFYGFNILISLAGTIIAMASRLLRPRVGWIFVCVLR